MKIIIGIIKLVISIVCFILGLALLVASGDGYPLLIMMGILLLSLISINNGVFLIKSGISEFKKKTLKNNYYEKISIILLLLSSIMIILFPIITLYDRKDKGMLIQGLIIILGLFDQIKIIKINKTR